MLSARMRVDLQEVYFASQDLSSLAEVEVATVLTGCFVRQAPMATTSNGS
jgi:hypothetical protein